jgi:hypothetical protein
MISTTDDEIIRTTPLAFWRYAHDHLRAARDLAHKHRIACIDSQVAFHVAAQGVEFALKAFLRARGVSVARLREEFGHSLARALAHGEALGLPFVPPRLRAAMLQVAVYHQDTHFLYRASPNGEFPDIDPLVDAGVYVLDCIAPEVAEHFVVNHGAAATPTAETFVRRLRADLSATTDGVAPAEVRQYVPDPGLRYAGTRP